MSAYILDNVALNKSAHQDFPYARFDKQFVQASNAVDGLRTNLSWQGAQCVISENNKKTATWWVNLTSILSIHHITIYYRTGNVQWGELLYKILSSVQTKCIKHYYCY